MSFTFDEKDLKQNTTEEHLPGGYNYAGAVARASDVGPGHRC